MLIAVCALAPLLSAADPTTPAAGFRRGGQRYWCDADFPILIRRPASQFADNSTAEVNFVVVSCMAGSF